MWLIREAFAALVFVVKAVFVFVAAVSLVGLHIHTIHIKRGDEMAYAALVTPGCLIVFWSLYRFVFDCARSARNWWMWRSAR
jgi:hypothetical protein